MSNAKAEEQLKQNIQIIGIIELKKPKNSPQTENNEIDNLERKINNNNLIFKRKTIRQHQITKASKTKTLVRSFPGAKSKI